jgi:CheY-like chemotaxis protein
VAEGQPEYRILIVEDQPENWTVLRRLLENAGFRVRVAENGAQGVKAFREWHPHFIWMDLRMPVMGGIEATRKIRGCDGGTEVKIVAVTASGFASERSNVLAKGMDDYVRKPYRPAEIFNCLTRHLGVRYRVSEPSPTTDRQEIERSDRLDLTALPVEMLAALRQALLTLDSAVISEVVERISTEDRPLGLTLSHYANRRAYTAILTAIQIQERALTRKAATADPPP